MRVIKGNLVKEWVKAVDKLCDSDPTYDWNDACRAVAHALENEKTVTTKKIKEAARAFWGNDDSRDFSITVADLEQMMHGGEWVSDDATGIEIMKPLRFKKKPRVPAHRK